jgi:hypothetical protein
MARLDPEYPKIHILPRKIVFTIECQFHQCLIDHLDAKYSIQWILRWWLPGGIVAGEKGVVQKTLNVFPAIEWWSKPRPL